MPSRSKTLRVIKKTLRVIKKLRQAAALQKRFALLDFKLTYYRYQLFPCHRPYRSDRLFPRDAAEKMDIGIYRRRTGKHNLIDS